MALITDTSLQAVQAALQERNAILDSIASMFVPTSFSWKRVQTDVRAGNATNYPIGMELMSSYQYNGTSYEYPWVVMDNNRTCTWQDGTTHPGLWLMAKYSVAEGCQFDAPEGEETTDTTAQANCYYCGVSGTTYTMLNLSTGDPVPLSSYDKVLKGKYNAVNVYKDGYSRWRDSGVRQWLNSDAAAGQWWASTHVGDNPPEQLSGLPGYMSRLDSDFLAVVNPVKVQTATATADPEPGVTDITYDKFFLISLEEAYGVPLYSGVDGAYFPYWKIATNLSEPSNGTTSSYSEARTFQRVTDHSTTDAGHMRSLTKGSLYNVWGSYSPGYLSSNVARHSRRNCPCCVVS